MATPEQSRRIIREWARVGIERVARLQEKAGEIVLLLEAVVEDPDDEEVVLAAIRGLVEFRASIGTLPGSEFPSDAEMN